MFCFGLIWKGLWTSLSVPRVSLGVIQCCVVWTGRWLRNYWETLVHFWEQSNAADNHFLSSYLFKNMRTCKCTFKKIFLYVYVIIPASVSENRQRFVANCTVVPWTRLDTVSPGRVWIGLLFWGNNERVSGVLDPSQFPSLGVEHHRADVHNLLKWH